MPRINSNTTEPVVPEPRPTTTCARCGKDFLDREMLPLPDGGELCPGCDSEQPYIIGSTEDKALFWHNEGGWVDRASATTFTREERESLNLPVHGAWIFLALAPSVKE